MQPFPRRRPLSCRLQQSLTVPIHCQTQKPRLHREAMACIALPSILPCGVSDPTNRHAQLGTPQARVVWQMPALLVSLRSRFRTPATTSFLPASSPAGSRPGLAERLHIPSTAMHSTLRRSSRGAHRVPTRPIQQSTRASLVRMLGRKAVGSIPPLRQAGGSPFRSLGAANLVAPCVFLVPCRSSCCRLTLRSSGARTAPAYLKGYPKRAGSALPLLT